MTQLQSLVYLMSLIIPLFIGITLLIVWRFDISQKFVRDFALSNLAIALFTLSHLVYLQKDLPYHMLGYWVAMSCSTLNMTFLISSMNRLAGFKLTLRHLLVIAAIIFFFIIIPTNDSILVKASVTLVVEGVLGAVSTFWLWRRHSNERYLGPLISALGASQLVVILFGPQFVYIQALETSLIRVVVGFLLLSSALHRSKQAIKKSFDRFRLMTEHSPQGVLVYKSPHIMYANETAQKIFGRSGTGELSLAYQEDTSTSGGRDELQHYSLQLEQGEIDNATWSEKRRRSDGKLLSLTMTAWRIEWDEESAVQVLITDETEMIESAMALQYQETHDALTGLPNRRVLVRQLNKYCYTDEQHSSCMLTILNINRFKLFNQGRGHIIGDRVLLEFANKLKNGVGPETEVMRLGGDEFGLVTSEVGDIEALNIKLKELCREPIKISDGDFFISVAIGQALYPNDAFNADGLLRAANAAMHQAKKIPGTSLVLADSRFEESLSRALEQEQALKNAITNREICLHYQPKVDSLTHQLVGFEALARWIKPGGGFVSPIEFIAVAEKTALISELGTMLLSVACKQIADWTREFGKCVPVAVNVSPIQLLNPNFVQLVSSLIEEHGIAAELLTLEITETAAINDLEQTQIQIGQLHELGVEVAMDDFGTGYSSLSMLRQLSLHVMKIDRGLIDPLPSTDAMAVVTSICQLAQALNMRVVAEGVETAGQSEAAQAAGCHELQGYLFSRPMSPADAGVWLSR